MDRKLYLVKDLATSFNLIGVILKDIADDLEQLYDEIIVTNDEETKEDTKPIEQYPIGED